MPDKSELSRVRAVAQHILAALGDRAPDWVVLDVIDTANGSAEGGAEPDLVLTSSFGGAQATSPPGSDSSVVVVVGTEDGSQSVRGYFSPALPEPLAIVALAAHLQDHASESSSSFGAALPPCPGHPHPLSPEVADGVAVWVCPRSAEHYRRPIAG